MGKIISVSNSKGGVGKTTSTFNISAVLASKGLKVLMVDLDPQASLTICTGLEPLDLEFNVTDVLRKGPESTEDCIYSLDSIPNLSILPSIIDLSVLEMELQSRTAIEEVLARSLNQVKGYFDFILIDCPPQLSLLTINSIVASDGVMICCKTDYLSYRGLENLTSTINDLKELVNEKVEILGVVATLYEKSVKDSNEILSLLKENYNVLGVVKKTIEAVKGVYEGLPVVVRSSNPDISKEYIKIAEIIMNA